MGNNNSSKCLCCGKNYNKGDYNSCPYCGGDGSNLTKREWKPNKHQKKEYARKMKAKE